MQFWPRKKARRAYASVRTWPESSENKFLGFAGYKVGMTHIIMVDNSKTSITKGEEVSTPVTIIECPPLKISSVRFYKKNQNKLVVVEEVALKIPKEVERKIPKRKEIKVKLEEFDNKVSDYDDIRVVVYTQPKMTGIGKKKPELFEMGIGGNDLKAKFDFIKESVNQEIKLSDVFQAGELVDAKSITTGKGTQGPVKRFGVKIRSRKSEKTKRGPGSLGGWKGHAHFMYRVAHAGQTGYHQRTEYNKWILKVSSDPEELKMKGGFIHYGNVKNSYVLIKGSLPGPKKRLIRFNKALRPNKKVPSEAPVIEYVSLESKQ